MTAKTAEEKQEIKDTVKYMNWVDMAVVISCDGSEEEKKKFEEKRFRHYTSFPQNVIRLTKTVMIWNTDFKK